MAFAEAGGTEATAVNIIGSAGFYGVTARGLRAATGGTKNIPSATDFRLPKNASCRSGCRRPMEQTDGVSLEVPGNLKGNAIRLFIGRRHPLRQEAFFGSRKSVAEGMFLVPPVAARKPRAVTP